MIDLEQPRRLDEERADDDGMAPSSFVHQPGEVAPDTTAPVPTLQPTADESLVRARDTSRNHLLDVRHEIRRILDPE